MIVFDDHLDRILNLATLTVSSTDFRVSAAVNYRYRSGATRGRTVRVEATNLASTIFAQQRGSSGRLDDAHIVDLRVAKEVRMGGNARLRLTMDGFNVFHTGLAEAVLNTLGTSESFNVPTSFHVPTAHHAWSRETSRAGRRLQVAASTPAAVAPFGYARGQLRAAADRWRLTSTVAGCRPATGRSPGRRSYFDSPSL